MALEVVQVIDLAVILDTAMIGMKMKRTMTSSINTWGTPSRLIHPVEVEVVAGDEEDRELVVDKLRFRLQLVPRPPWPRIGTKFWFGH